MPLKRLFIVFISWRLILFIPLIIAYYFLPFRSGFEYVTIWKFTLQYFPVDSFLLYPWANFDGIHYLFIAGDGYNLNGRFLPLYPLVIRGLSFLFGTGGTFGAIQFFTAFLVANISFLLSLILFYKLIMLDYSKDIAQKSILFLLLFPTSFFFASVYSESLFLLLLLLSFYYARKKQWILSSTFATFLSVTRLVGICILPALLWEYFKENKTAKKNSIYEGLSFLLVPLSLIAYIWFNAITWKNPFYFLTSHGEIANSRSVGSIILFPQTLVRYLKILTTLPYSQFELWIAVLEVGVFFFGFILLYIAWKKKIRTSYLIFSFLAFFIPTSSGTLTGLPRYILVLFPVFIALALINNKYIQMIYLIVSAILLFVLLAYFSRGYYIA